MVISVFGRIRSARSTALSSFYDASNCVIISVTSVVESCSDFRVWQDSIRGKDCHQFNDASNCVIISVTSVMKSCSNDCIWQDSIRGKRRIVINFTMHRIAPVGIL